jgi:hypothetical protein
MRVALDRDGDIAAVVDDGRLAMFDGSDRPTEIAVHAPVLAAACFRDHMWAVFGGSAPCLARLAAGRITGNTIPVVPDPGLRLIPATLGPPAAVVVGPICQLVRELGNSLVSRELGAGIGYALPVLRGRVIVASRDEVIALDGDTAAWRVRSPIPGGVVTEAAAIMEGQWLALHLRRGDEQGIALLSMQRGSLVHLVRLHEVRTVRFAARRGLAVCSGGDDLVVVDVRRGKVATAIRRPGVIDLAVDQMCDQLLLVIGGDAPQVIRYRWRDLEAHHAVEPPRIDTSIPAAAGEPEDVAPQPPPAAPDPPQPMSPPLTPAPARPARSVSPTAPLPTEDAPIELDLTALRPRPPVGVSREEALGVLGLHLELVGAWCGLAIAQAWDSGRLSTQDPQAHLYQNEVDAVLAYRRGAASEAIARMQARVTEAADKVFSAEHALAGRVLPLVRLAIEFELSPLAMHILMVIAAPLLWGELARLYAILTSDPSRPSCDELLVSQILGNDRGDRYQIAYELDDERPLMRFGLVSRAPGRTRPFASLVIAPQVIQHLRYEAASPGREVVHHPATVRLDDLVVAPGVLAQLARDLAAAGDQPLRLVVCGNQGSGRRSLAAALAALAGRPLGVIDASSLGNEPAERTEWLRTLLDRSLLAGWLPMIDYLDDGELGVELGPLREVLRSHPGAIAFRCGREQTPPVPPGHIRVQLATLDEATRVACWTAALARHEVTAVDVAPVAARYRVGPGVIERVAAHVAPLMRRVPGESSTPAPAAPLSVIDQAIRQHLEARLGTVATRVTRLPSWSEVVLPADVTDSLLELIARVRHRRRVFDDWGFDRRASSLRGITALFQGSPGTGKSMIAGVIARELGLELYRVDLSRVMSKWLGETERNLAAVFEAAEDSQAIILFDEADSLFAKRTEVQSSHDRYANLEVNYLLQRLDTFEGIAILTTNFGKAIDAAFRRRMTLRLTFPFPDDELREQLWQVHLPSELPTEGALDLSALARRYRLSGGYIRNAVMRGAFLAANESRALSQEHLERAVHLEFQEMGKLTDGGVIE